MSIDPLVAAFCARLEALRVKRGLTQKAVADLLETGQGTVQPWFKGEKLPSAEMMLRLPAALGVSGHYLLTGEMPIEPPGEVAESDHVSRVEATAAIARLEQEIAQSLAAARAQLAPAKHSSREERKAAAERRKVRVRWVKDDPHESGE